MAHSSIGYISFNNIKFIARLYKGPLAQARLGPLKEAPPGFSYIRSKTRNPGPGATTLPTTHAEMESKARNPGPGPHIAKGPA